MEDELPGQLKPTAAAWVPVQQTATTEVPFVEPDYGSHEDEYATRSRQLQLEQEAYESAETKFNMAFLEAERLKCRACEPLPQRCTYGSIQLPDELRAYYAHSLKLTLDHIPLTDPRNKEVPKGFSLVNPLDDPRKSRGAAGTTGYPTSVFKVLNRKDGLIYALRRVDNVRGVQTLQQRCDLMVHNWGQIRHANIVALRQAFVHQRAVFFVHDYWPGAQTLLDYVSVRGMGNLLAENVLWSIATQLLTAMRVVHDKKISFRGSVSLNHILLTGRNRVRLGSAGVMHFLDQAKGSTLEEDSMRSDVTGLGKVLLVLACMSTQALGNWKESLEFVSSRYSKELTSLIALPFQRPCTVYDVLALCSRGLLSEMDELYSHSDALDEHLCRQIETGRINRLLEKLGLVTERPEYGKSESASWAETGDRYILKLFRNYVFHQTDDTGQPWLDIGHIHTCLNKLDTGSMEKILLTSPDGRSILVVTFADVRKCLEDAFQELVAGHRSSLYYQEKKLHPARVMTRPNGAPGIAHPSVAAAMMYNQGAAFGHPYGHQPF
mmetsp:Transcript_13198/g.24478  ORF Transcript_13198/g.24478 Transcript_13198/m.24478 type:complete len:550 (+) Transcript_13198:246-1895(+)